MSSWIWLKDLDQPIPDTAMDPVSEYDDRQSVPELLLEYASKIEEVKEQIKDDPLYDKLKHDDLWILRFLLSQKNKVKKAVKAAKQTLQFRQKHQLDVRDLRFDVPHKVPKMEGTEDIAFAGSPSFQRSWLMRYPEASLIFTIPDENRGVIGFLRFADFQNDSETMRKLTDEDVAAPFIYLSEWAFQWLDYVTRKTGRLTKSVRFVDFAGFSIFQANREASKRDGKVMGEMEDVYPQLLQSLCFYNTPSFMHKLWGLFRPIMPSRVVEKVDIMDPKTNEKERARVLKFMSYEQMPIALGGKNPIHPNDW